MGEEMSIFKKIFGKQEDSPVCPIPPWEEIVDHMQGQGLSCFTDQVVNVLVSLDLSKRILILQSESGYYKTVYEEIHVFDEDEWAYFCKDPGRYPAWWEPVNSSINTKSFYFSEADALKEIKAAPEYTAYFE